MITVIKTKPNHLVHRKKREEHIKMLTVIVFLLVIYFPLFCVFHVLKNVAVVHTKCQKLVKKPKKDKT